MLHNLSNFLKFSKSQKKRLRKNFFSQFYNIIFLAGSQLFFPPLMILLWGVDQFGIWIFFISIPATLALFNINFTAAARQEMIIFDTKGEFRKVKKIFHSSLVLVLVNIVLFSFIIFFSYFFIDYNFAALKSLSVNETNKILFFIVLAFYLEIFNSIFIAGISFRGKFYLNANIKTCFEFLIRVAIILSGLFFETLVFAAIIYLTFNIIKTGVYYYYFKKNNAYLTISIKQASINEVKSLIKLSSSHIIDMTTKILKQNGPILLLGIFFNPIIIAYISTCRTLFYNLPNMIVGVFNNISEFEYAEIFAKNKIEEFKSFHKKHIIFVLGLLFLFLIGSTTIGPMFYKLWLGGEFKLGLLFMLLIILDGCFYGLKNSVIISMRSLNRFFKISVIELVILLLGLFISYYYLTRGYDYISHFLIILFSTIIVLFISAFIVRNDYKKLNK